MSKIRNAYGILDGGATSTCGSYDLIQTNSDEWEAIGQETTVENRGNSSYSPVARYDPRPRQAVI